MARRSSRSTVATTRPAGPTCLIVSVTGSPGTTVRAALNLARNAVDEPRDQRAGGVVHEHHVGIGRERGQRPADRLLPGRAAGDLLALRRPPRSSRRVRTTSSESGGGDHDEVDRPGPSQSPYRVDEHRHAAQEAQRLGGARPRRSPRPAAGTMAATVDGRASVRRLPLGRGCLITVGGRRRRGGRSRHGSAGAAGRKRPA